MSGAPFRRRDALRQWELHFGPNMTPMVDVVMVILIFFMASAAFVGPEWFLRSITTPEPTAEDESARAALVLPPASFPVRLRRGEGGTTLASGFGLREAPIAALCDRITAGAAQGDPDEMLIVIRPDPSVPYEDIVRVHEACERAGVSRVGLAQ